ncbi:MAG: FAD/NAD(P)-binding oxidoreductase [Spirochaetes bacterium]|nr:MAG: FAD/NAD(P)-binding oxidoreductase [Spirochaetota bacterium]
MKNDIYDICIIGAGVSGASIARKLSSYKLDIVVVEKEVDVSFGVSKGNSGIIHAGFHHPPNSLKSKLEILGNRLFDTLHEELHFPFKRSGIIVAALSEEEMKTVQFLHNQGINNGVIGIEICNRERILQLEPNLTHDVVGGLYAPSGGIIEPYQYVFSLVESAKKNGVDIITDFEVTGQEFKSGYYTLYSRNGSNIKSRYVINAAGLFADEISKLFNAESYEIYPRKGEYFLLDKNIEYRPSRVIFPVPTKVSKGILVVPTIEGTTLLGPTAVPCNDKFDLSTNMEELEKVLDFTKHLVPKISKRDIITSFAGLRPAATTEDFIISLSEKAYNFINVGGIQSPGLTASPAIAEMVKDILKKTGITLIEKKNFDPYLEKPQRIREIQFEDAESLYKKDPAYANIICRCENVSEAEIVNAIKKGHTTLDGIKFYTRAQMGRCQGGFCSYKIIKIIERETGLSPFEITKRGGKSILFKDKVGF